jgi:hypothetical protein
MGILSVLNQSNLMLNLKKSQSAVEFTMLLAALSFFFLLFLAVINENMIDKTKERQEIILKGIANNVLDEINFASSSVNGYKRNFNIPEDAGGVEYEISIIDHLVYVKTERISLAYPIQNIVGEIKKGENIISKENNIIYLNNGG